MNYKAGFIVSFFIVALMHFYVLNYELNKKAVKIYSPVKKVSNVINLQQVSIKEPEPIIEPEVKKMEPKPEPIVEKVIPIPVEKKKPIKKKVTKKKKMVKKSSVMKISGPKQRAIKDNYYSQVRREIEKKKKYPNVSLRRKEEGTVYIKFTINKNGSIRDIKVTERSRYKRLNQAAVKILKEIGSFPSIPKELGKNYLLLTVPIKYNIK